MLHRWCWEKLANTSRISMSNVNMQWHALRQFGCGTEEAQLIDWRSSIGWVCKTGVGGSSNPTLDTTFLVFFVCFSFFIFKLLKPFWVPFFFRIKRWKMCFLSGLNFGHRIITLMPDFHVFYVAFSPWKKLNHHFVALWNSQAILRHKNNISNSPEKITMLFEFFGKLWTSPGTTLILQKCTFDTFTSSEKNAPPLGFLEVW